MFLYHLLISPLEYLLEVIFTILFRIFGSVPATLLFLSLAVNILTMPLYRRAELLSDEERKKQEEMRPRLALIRRSFRGDERTMMIARYYRCCSYSQLQSIGGILPLLLQIPFFLAAYRFLSGLERLRECELPFIGSLGEPDGMLTLFGTRVSLLPFVMTAVNLLSVFVYSKGRTRKEKAGMILPALLFLILLYPSPAGLVLYWTLNNLFSLLRNILDRLGERKKAAVRLLSAAFGLAVLAGSFFSGRLLGDFLAGKTAEGVCLLLLCLAFVILPFPLLSERKKKKELQAQPVAAWLLPSLLMVLLTGGLIPMKLIAASPQEFVNIFDYRSPFLYVLHAFLVSAGCFLVWGGIFRGLSDAEGKNRLGMAANILAAACLADYFLFGAGEGVISSSLVFSQEPSYDGKTVLLNLLCAGLCALLFALLQKWPRRHLAVLALLCLSCVLITAADALKVSRSLSELPAESGDEGTVRILPLSENGRNVIVLMLDRAIGAYVPYLFAEKPELKEHFDGFTWYPNTVSSGGFTIFGMPALFGGYDYTAERINERDELSVAEKVNDALRVLPRVFGEEGYRVSVCDPPYAGFSELPDLSIYDDMPYVEAHRLWGRFEGGMTEDGDENSMTERNFFFYGLMEALPQLFRAAVYDGGSYLSSEDHFVSDPAFRDNYRAMDAYPELCRYEEEGDNLLILCSNLTHSPALLEKPDYRKPMGSEEGRPDRHKAGEMELDTSMYLGEEHYDVNMAAFLLLADWFDEMRNRGVYDNSRIIIVADHGYALGQFEELRINEELDAEAYNPLLMVKDFGAKGFTVDDGFMSNADVPALAVEGLLEDARDPFTGRKLDFSEKPEEIRVTLSTRLGLGENGGNLLNTGGTAWYSVRDNIFQKKNWKLWKEAEE
ncbi:MAG: YidC/Oxa1 family membrane protein insertase [Lachnospiraceae bacterium]|nr:YidC/Oxa1 family membrane protein insertase [Lachnospiraceae bacterium]